MNYISSKELSAIWGISSTRIIAMAKKGQIHGAKLIGNSWIFPDNVVKPLDGRFKKNKVKNNEAFHYPLLSLKKWDTSMLSDEEQSFFSVEKKFLSLDFEASYKEFTAFLSSTTNTTLIAGCYYYLCSTCGMLQKYEESIKYYELFKELLSKDIPYKKELYLLFMDISSYVIDNNPTSETSFEISEYDSSCGPELLLMLCYKTMIDYLRNEKSFDIRVLEMNALILTPDMYPAASIYLNIYLALLNSMLNNKNLKYSYAKKAFDIAFQYNYLYPIVVYYNYFFDILPTLEKEYSKEILESIREKNTIHVNSLRELKIFVTCKNTPLLSIEDYEYFGYLFNGLKSSEVAKIKGISERMVFEKYKVIREQLGAKNKKELLEKFKKYIIDRT